MVDTTGAGDCFTGALAVGILEGMQLQEAMKFAGKKAMEIETETSEDSCNSCHIYTCWLCHSGCIADSRLLYCLPLVGRFPAE